MGKIKKSFALGAYNKDQDGNLIQQTSSTIEEINKISDNKKDDFKLRYIPYEKIVRNPENRVADKDIDDLAESISAVGLLDALRVSEQADGTYMLIAGERRWRAIGLIREKNPQAFSTIPAVIEDKESDKLKLALRLMDSNEQRVNLEPAEKRKNIELIEKLYKERKSSGEYVDVNVTARIAKALNISERQVQKISSVNKKLIPELQTLFDEKEISLDTASAIAQLDELFQKELASSFEEEGKINKEDIDFYKEEDKKLRTENGELKKQLEEVRKMYKKAIEDVKQGEDETQKENIINALEEEKSNKIDEIAKDLVLRKKNRVIDNEEKVSKMVDKICSSQLTLKRLIEDGVTLSELDKTRIRTAINKIEQSLT